LNFKLLRQTLLRKRLRYGEKSSKAYFWWSLILDRCELGVGAQNRTLPQISYTPPPFPEAVSLSFLHESSCLANATLWTVPPVSHELKRIFTLMHQLSLLQTGSMTKYNQRSKVKTTDRTIVRIMYDLECSLLQILSAQRMNSHTISRVDAALAEACHLLFWIGPRGLPPEMKLCDRLIAWLKEALVDLIERFEAPFFSPSYTHARLSSLPVPSSEQNVSATGMTSCSPALDAAVLWCLCIGTLASSAHSRPENPWYREQFCRQMEKMSVQNRTELRQALGPFPNIEGFSWMCTQTLDRFFNAPGW